MKSPTQIIKDTRAFLRSTAATVAGVAVSIATLAAGIIVFLPDQYADLRAGIIATGSIAGVVGGAARQLYAWLDPKNASFGRVTVDVVEDPTDPEAIEQYLTELSSIEVDESALPDEHTTAEGVETQPEPKGN